MIRPFLVPAFLLLAATAASAQTAAQKPGVQRPTAAAAVPAPPRSNLPPVDPALKAALQGTAANDPVVRFYTLRNFAPAWSKTDQQELMAALEGADRHALIQKDYLPNLDGVKDPVQRDIRLTRSALAYAKALAMGRVDPETVESIFTLRRNVVDVAAGLNGALASAKLAPWLDSLAPNDKGYEGLSRGYLRYRDIALKGGWPAFKLGAKIEPGALDPRVPALAARLLAEGDLDSPVTGNVYTPELVEAVKIFQVRHGLLDDGIIGADTQDELMATAEDRARMIATNLERRRWLARFPAAERIDVNTAASLLVYWRNGQTVHASRVVNGKATSATPSLEAPFSSVLANPPWNVPGGIAAKEILPRGPGYLAAQNMYVTGGRVVQRPGPKSALGLVKFEVTNPYAIYLHDTPSKRFFAAYQRHLSHGCVRVENAVDFARLLLASNPAALAQFDAAQASGDTTRVSLGREIPVRLLYWTAFMTGADRVAFRKDVYKLDDKLGQALGVGGLSFIPADRTKAVDVGP
jgi:murein L,D-transpeptidase YcbB/YkuD